jgi:hypothetical protein
MLCHRGLAELHPSQVGQAHSTQLSGREEREAYIACIIEAVSVIEIFVAAHTNTQVNSKPWTMRKIGRAQGAPDGLSKTVRVWTLSRGFWQVGGLVAPRLLQMGDPRRPPSADTHW